MTAPVAKDRSDPSPGAPSPDHPVWGPPGLFTEVRRPSTCGTPRITNLFFRSANPSRFSRMSPNSRISAGFSKFSFKAGMNSATKRGLSFGSVAMKAGSMVKLFSAGWQVPQVRPFPPNVSLKNRSLPFAMSWLKRSRVGAARATDMSHCLGERLFECPTLRGAAIAMRERGRCSSIPFTNRRPRFNAEGLQATAHNDQTDDRQERGEKRHVRVEVRKV